MPDRLAQLNVLLLCNHTVHYIRLSFLFQSTLPRGERRAYPDRSHMPQNFNPRSHEGSDGHGTASLRRQHNFNPRSHEGSDIIRLAESLGMRISIRAPARGATTVSVCAEFSGSNFNPRSREGSDAWQKADWLYYQISIRAPARGATGRPCQLLYVKGFQSALPRGERLPLTRGMLQVHDFNPRSREGSDTIWSDIVSRTGISIRAPARGATTERSYLLDMDVISIRAPARGATRAISPGQLYCKHFNPRSREGSDAALPPAFPLPCEFQSALPRGERLHKLRKLLL